MRHVGLTIACITVVIGCVAIFATNPGTTHHARIRPSGGIYFKEEEAYWKKRLQVSDASKAYAEFVRSAEPLQVSQQHEVAHAFGQALWETKGMDGVSVCDEQFSNGCKHSFFGTAISDLGATDGVAKLAAQCLTPAGQGQDGGSSCFHGIGHGVQSHFGYSEKDLVSALDLCATLPKNSSLTMGCYGGAVMEYNMRTLMRTETPLRTLILENRYTPCIGLSPSYQPSCMFWQSPWWYWTLVSERESAADVFEKIGEYCRDSKLPGKMSDACFAGFAFDTSQRLHADPATVVKACRKATGSGKERVLCSTYAAPAFTAEDRSYFLERVCDGLSGTEANYCQAHKKDTVDLLNTRGKSVFP